MFLPVLLNSSVGVMASCNCSLGRQVSKGHLALVPLAASIFSCSNPPQAANCSVLGPCGSGEDALRGLCLEGARDPPCLGCSPSEQAISCWDLYKSCTNTEQSHAFVCAGRSPLHCPGSSHRAPGSPSTGTSSSLLPSVPSRAGGAPTLSPRAGQVPVLLLRSPAGP